MQLWLNKIFSALFYAYLLFVISKKIYILGFAMRLYYCSVQCIFSRPRQSQELLYNHRRAWFVKTVFKVRGKKNYHCLNMAQRFCYVNLWQNFTCYIYYFWMYKYVYKISRKCYPWKKSSNLDERARKVRQNIFLQKLAFWTYIENGAPCSNIIVCISWFLDGEIQTCTLYI